MSMTKTPKDLSEYPKWMKIPITFTPEGEQRYRSHFRNATKLPKYKTVLVYSAEEETQWKDEIRKDKYYEALRRKKYGSQK